MLGAPMKRFFLVFLQISLLVSGLPVGLAMIRRRKETAEPEPNVPETLEAPRVKVYSNPSSLS